VRRLKSSKKLHTVCEEAQCPNLGECWGSGTATFLILGDVCTRDCRFCNVKSGRPEPPDPDEPARVAEAVAAMELRHAVITSVTRDDLADGGASLFADVIRAIHDQAPGCSVEVLIPDFRGDPEALETVMAARPEILNHNVETVPRLYPTVRPQADFDRSLEVLRRARQLAPAGVTKSGIMVGLGENREEIQSVLESLRAVGCDVLTVGQYLSPSRRHLPVQRYYTPEEFLEIRDAALALGFRCVESAPLVRSSYHAAEQAEQLGAT
jgi:lipoic acid synthetase